MTHSLTHSYMWHDSFIQIVADFWCLTHSYVRRDSFICATWLIHMCNATDSYMRRDSFIWATWLIHDSFICDSFIEVVAGFWVTFEWVTSHFESHMNESRRIYGFWVTYEWVTSHMNESQRDSFIEVVAGLLTHSYVWRDLFIRATWLIHMCDMTHSCVRHDSFIEVGANVSWRIHSYVACVRRGSLICGMCCGTVEWDVWMNEKTRYNMPSMSEWVMTRHSYERRVLTHSFICGML